MNGVPLTEDVSRVQRRAARGGVWGRQPGQTQERCHGWRTVSQIRQGAGRDGGGIFLKADKSYLMATASCLAVGPASSPLAVQPWMGTRRAAKGQRKWLVTDKGFAFGWTRMRVGASQKAKAPTTFMKNYESSLSVDAAVLTPWRPPPRGRSSLRRAPRRRGRAVFRGAQGSVVRCGGADTANR